MDWARKGSKGSQTKTTAARSKKRQNQEMGSKEVVAAAVAG